MVILLMLSILGFCLIINQIKAVTPSESPLLACCGIIAMLYAFALADLLVMGVYIILYVGVLMIPLAFWLNRRNLSAHLRELFDPGFVVFVLLLVALYPICRPIVTGAWDEYSHWALIVRNMLLTGVLPKPGGAIFYLSYPPATSLFQYFFMEVTNGPEGLMYYGQAILLASCLSMLVKGQSFKKPWLLLMAFMLPVLVMIKFSVHNIFNIFPDTIMAVLAISCFASYFSSKRELPDIIKIMPMLFVLCLVRPNAIIFALYAVVLIAVDRVLNDGFRNNKTALYLVLPLIAIVLGYASWKIHLNLIGVKSAQTSLLPFDMPRFMTLLDNFKRAVFFNKLGNVYGPLSLGSSTAAFVLMAIALMIILSLLLKKKKKIRRSFNVLQMTFIVCFIIHTLSLLYAYQYIFSEQTADTLDSFHRYMGTFFMFWIPGIFYMMVTVLTKEGDAEGITKKGLLALCIAVILVIGGRSHPRMLDVLGSRRLENPYEVETKACAEEIQGAVGTEAKVYMIYQKSRGYTFMATRYQLGTNPANLGTWSLGKPYCDSDTWTVDLEPQALLDRLVELKYEYVYIGNGDDQLWESYGMLFDKPDAGYKVFKVKPTAESPLIAVK